MRSLVLCAVLGGCGFQATRALDPDAAPQELDGGATVDGAIDGAIDGALLRALARR